MTLEGPRILDKGFSGGSITNTSPPDTPGATGTGGLDKLSDTVFCYRSYYDLSGYTLDDLTCFFAGVDIQEDFTPNGDNPCYIVDLITTHQLSSTEIIAAHFDAATGELPGFNLSTFDMKQVIYGRTRTFDTSTSWAPAVVQEYGRTQWGTCTASTSEKIYLTRIIYMDIGLGPGLIMNIPSCNYVTSVVVGREKELSFLMRQRRSYEEATGLDDS